MMRTGTGGRLRGKFSFLTGALLIAALAAAAATIVVVSSNEARALPSFARQTGQPCGACHTDFPQLTPFGRRFKLGGYTLMGGEQTDIYKKTFGGSSNWIPPLSIMGVVGYTHTQADQDTTGQPIASNNNFIAQAFSVFYGGALTDNIGAFIQATYSYPPNSLNNNFTWDNADVRYANTATIGKTDITYGVTVHNNPTMQDVWNTTPAWGFPFVASNIAPTPSAATLIEGAFAQRALGVGGYAFINDMLYLELTGYKGINPRFLDRINMDGTDQPGTIDQMTPYFRAAFEPHWGDHWLMVGAFGWAARVNPQGIPLDLYSNPLFVSQGVTPPTTVAGTDKYTDLGFDAQYQYITNAVRVTAKASYIREQRKLDSTFAAGNSANPTNNLNSFKANLSLTWGENAKVVLTGHYFSIWGTTDPILYGDSVLTGSPNSNGWIAEIAYIPWGMDRSPLWPYANARIGLQYVWYDKFNGASVNYDGNGRNARDNNTLYAYLWFAM